MSAPRAEPRPPGRLGQRLIGSAAARRDLVLAAALTVFSVVLYQQAALLPPPFFDPLGSAAVPKFVALVLLALAAGLVVQRAFGLAEGGMAMPTNVTAEAPVRPAPLAAIGAIILPILYVASMQAGLLAFAQASSLFVLALGGLFARWRWRNLALLLPLALLTGYGLDYIFTEILYVDLPQRSLLTGG